MAAHVEIVSTDLRRVKVKVTPGSYLVDVLGEACRKLNVNSDKYELKHKQKTVDLTGPFRTSGLVSGAKLELVQKSKSASVVSIALDINGKRYTKKLPSDMTLWQTLRQIETSETGLNITGRAVPVGQANGQLYHEAPIVNIMGREYARLEDLQKTLSQCGINSGSMVLRVSFKLTEKTLFEAMSDISKFLEPEQPEAGKSTEAEKPAEQKPTEVEQPVEQKPTEAEKSTAPTLISTNEEQQDKSKAVEASITTVEPPAAPAEPPNTETVEAKMAEPAAESDRMDIDEPVAAASEPVDRLQPTNVFAAPQSSTPAAAAIREDDSVYEPTIAHAQLRQQQLLKRAQNTRLKSDAELAAIAAEEAERLAKITKVEIKVRFPDQTSATWTASPEETGAWLYQAIRSAMAHPNQPFKLVLPGPKTQIEENDKKLIAGYQLKTRELIHLLWDDSVPQQARKDGFLKSSLANKAQAIPIPEVPKESPGEEDNAAAGPSTQPAKSDKAKNMDPDVMKKKLSKILGFGKKK